MRNLKKNGPVPLFLATLLSLFMVSPATTLNDSELNWLATVPGFVEGFMSVGGEPVRLDDWQREQVAYEGDSISEKSRQVGFSFAACAAKAMAKSQLLDRHTSVFTSMNLDDAREKIIYARELYDSIPRRARVKLTTDNKMELGFSNGSRIVTMFMPRGKGPADAYIDEMEYMRNAREIYRAARYMTLRGGQLIIGSTPVSKIGVFSDILNGAGDRFKGFKKFSIPWWLSSALCKDVPLASVEAPQMLTEERVYRFGNAALIDVFEASFLDDFQQECELLRIDSEAAFISIDQILSCCDQELQIYSDFEDLKKDLKGVPYLGFDVGRRRNPSELVIIEQLGDKFYERMIVSMHRKSFDEQKFIISRALDVLPIAHACIDETGIGMNIAEDLAKSYPHIVEPVNFSGRVEAKTPGKKKATVAVKERLATITKIAFERNLMSIYPDRDLINQIHSIKKEVTPLGNIRYSVEKNEEHHADKFWALALALFAANAGDRIKRAGIW